MSRAQPNPGPYRVGDRVKVLWRRPVVGEIIEDRGLIGHRGRHYYTVSIMLSGADEPLISEYPAEELEIATAQDIESRTGH